jgi:K+-sensing histidine kinase KdpD
MAAIPQGSSVLEKQNQPDNNSDRRKKRQGFRRFGLAGRISSGLLICLTAALVVARLFSRSPLRQYVPLAFIVVIALVSTRFGGVAGMLGGLLAAAVFAYFLFPPLNSLRIDDGTARENLSWMILCSLAISFLLFPPQSGSRG